MTLKIPVQALPGPIAGSHGMGGPGAAPGEDLGPPEGAAKGIRRRLQPVPQAVLIIMKNIEESERPS